MFHLVYSNYPESLIDELAKNISLERERNTIWEPINLIVPNLIIKEYLYIQLAHRLEVAANLNVRCLDDVIQGLLKDNYKLLTTKLLQESLLSIMSDADYLKHDLLAPVRNYLHNDQLGLKPIQLAAKLANLYDNYANNCPELIQAWRQGQCIAKQAPHIEVWQQKLWLKVIDSLDITGSRYITMPEIIALPTSIQANSIPNIHAFGITHLAQTYHKIFAKLGTLGEFYLYAINPCQEFWEDLIIDDELIGHIINHKHKDNKELTKYANKAPDHDLNCYQTTPDGPSALRYWGRTGRDNIRLLNNISNYDFDACFIEANVETVLHKLQKDILFFQEPSAITNHALIENIHFIACPSKRRETEVLAAAIWQLIETSTKDNPLRFSDIAVIVPPNEEASYISHIQAAFQEANEIPYVGKNNINNNLKNVIELTELLLDLPLSGLTRAAVLRIIAHPTITKRFGIIDTQLWTQLCESLGIICGASHLDWLDTYIDQDVLNWDQGLRRLTLGLFMANDTEVVYGNNKYLPLTANDPILTGCFLHFMRKLITDVNQLQHGYQELRYWLSDIKQYLTTWLLDEDEALVQAIEQVLNTIQTLLAPTIQGLLEPKLNYNSVKYLAKEAMEKLRNQQFQSLFGGVVVANYAQVRNIPFKAVFLIGLGDGIFPAKDEHSALDLRATEYPLSNLTQSDNDKQLFLESLMATRQYLYLSYVNKDIVTGESLEPSSIYQKLLTIVKSYTKQDLIPTQHPLYRFDPVYFPQLFTNNKIAPINLGNYTTIAQNEAIAVWLKQQLPVKTSQLTVNSDLIEQIPSLKPVTNLKYSHKMAITDPHQDKVITIAITDLRKWLECPITGAAAIRLGLRKDAWHDKRIVENEVLINSTLNKYKLIRETTLLSSSSAAPEPIYDAAIKVLQAKGQSPFALFEQMERKENLKLIHAWLTLLKSETPVTCRLGPSSLGQNAVKNVLPPLNVKVLINGQDYQIKLVGDLQPQLWGGSLLLEIGKPPKTNLNTVQKKALKAYVDHIILTCIKHQANEHHAWLLFTGEHGNMPEIRSFAFEPISEDVGLKVLTNWIQDLFASDNATLMPIEAILAANSPEEVTAASIRDYVDTRINSGIGGFSGFYGPVPNLHYYDPPNNITEIIQRRLSHFLDQIQKFNDDK